MPMIRRNLLSQEYMVHAAVYYSVGLQLAVVSAYLRTDPTRKSLSLIGHPQPPKWRRYRTAIIGLGSTIRSWN